MVRRQGQHIRFGPRNFQHRERVIEIRFPVSGTLFPLLNVWRRLSIFHIPCMLDLVKGVVKSCEFFTNRIVVLRFDGLRKASSLIP